MKFQLSLSEIAATKKLGELASQSYKLERAERKTNFDEPGWKIERKYDNSVKIGNWFEERRSVLEHLTNSGSVKKNFCKENESIRLF